MLMTAILFTVGCKKEKSESKKGSIYGMVTDYATGEPVGSASVQLRPSGETTLTGADGMYEFLDVDAGSYSITVSKNEYTDLIDDYVIELKDGKRMRRDVQIKKKPSYIFLYNYENQEISVIDFGSDNGVTQKSFNLYNGGTKKYNFNILNTANWLSVDKTSGFIEVGATKTVVITIDRSKLSSGDNTTTLLITAEEGGSKELTVKAQKSGDFPVVSILEAISIDDETYRIRCEVVSEGGQVVNERGICYNTFGAPTLDDEVIKYTNGGLGQYAVTMEHLDTSKHYYVCAYAKNAMGESYSHVLEFEPGSGSVSLPMVITSEVTDVTQTTAKGGGNVTDEGSSPVTERGICWSTSHHPTTSDNHGNSGSGTGSYTVSMTGLSANITYYVRAYAVNSQGTSYGDEVSFNYEVNATMPTVTTKPVTDITRTSAKCGGDVVSAGGAPVTERGVCWGTSPNPTTSGDHANSSAGGTGSYFVNIDGLTPNTTYYVRAYAKNELGTAYGSGEVFTTLPEATLPEGAINGLFSVSETQQVWFSQGNLQYIGSASPAYWRFAENQWDCLGISTGQDSDATDVDRDLFGWATSGWYSGITGINYYMPYDVATGNNYYGPLYADLTDEYANADWGVYNAINNGGNTPGMWRTLSQAEWDYVFSKRDTPSKIRFAKAVVNDVKGVIVLPDNWASTNYVLASINNASASYNGNVVSAADWTNILEPKGAVFLPAAGMRNGTTVESLGEEGKYWSTSKGGSYGGRAKGVSFKDSEMTYADNLNSELNKSMGGSVRLIYEYH